MSKGKLAKFADMERFENVFQYPYSVVDDVPFDMKGKWREMYFHNDNPIVLELGCGKGEYTVELAKLYPEMNFIGVDIKIQNLKKIYNGNTVLDIDNLGVAKGELIGLVGNNGAGKTTLLRLILDLIQADDGFVESNGQKVNESETWKEYTGSYIDGRFLIDFLTPEEYFDFIADVYHIDDETLQERLAQFEGFMHDEIMGTKKYLRDFSQGNRQKIGIIGAMIINPKVLLLDEPFNYLDPSSQMTIAHMIQRICKEQGTTVIISSHNLNFVADISSRILLLEKGKLVKDLPNADGAAIAELNEYFGIQAE